MKIRKIIFFNKLQKLKLEGDFEEIAKILNSEKDSRNKRIAEIAMYGAIDVAIAKPSYSGTTSLKALLDKDYLTPSVKRKIVREIKRRIAEFIFSSDVFEGVEINSQSISNENNYFVIPGMSEFIIEEKKKKLIRIATKAIDFSEIDPMFMRAAKKYGVEVEVEVEVERIIAVNKIRRPANNK